MITPEKALLFGFFRGYFLFMQRKTQVLEQTATFIARFQKECGIQGHDFSVSVGLSWGREICRKITKYKAFYSRSFEDFKDCGYFCIQRRCHVCELLNKLYEYGNIRQQNIAKNIEG